MRNSLLILFFSPLVAFGQMKLESSGSHRVISLGDSVHIHLSIQAETTAWQAAVIANGGAYCATDTRAVDYFVRECKARGIWSTLDWVALFAGRNLSAALVPLKRTVGDAVIGNNNFLEVDFSPAIGLTGNGTTKDLSPNLNRILCRASNDVSLGVYITVNGGTGGATRGLIGTAVAGNLHVFVDSSNNATSGRVNNSNPISTTGGQVPMGMTGISRSVGELDSFVFSHDGFGQGSQTVGGGSASIRVFSRAGVSYWGGSLGGAWFGGGLTIQQVADFEKIWNNTMKTLSRQNF